MKRYIQIVVRSRSVGEKVFRQLVELFPEGLAPAQYFDVKLLDNDPRLDQFTSILADHGIFPDKLGEKHDEKSFVLRPHYEYEPEDLARADYFRAQFDRYNYLAVRRDETEPVVWVERFDLSDLLIAESEQSRFRAVNAVFVAALEEAGIDRLTLLDATPYPGDGVNEVSEHFGSIDHVVPWEMVKGGPIRALTGLVELPPLHPDTVLLDKNGQPATDEMGRGGFLHEGRFPRDEFHYLRDQIAGVEPFDVAYTREMFGKNFRWQNLIFSRRFYDLCNDMGVKATWTPVYVDDE